MTPFIFKRRLFRFVGLKEQVEANLNIDFLSWLQQAQKVRLFRFADIKEQVESQLVRFKLISANKIKILHIAVRLFRFADIKEQVESQLVFLRQI